MQIVWVRSLSEEKEEESKGWLFLRWSHILSWFFSLSFLKCLSLDFFLILRCSFLTPVCSSLPSAFPQYIFINCYIFLGNWSFCDYVMSFVSCVSFSVYFVWYCVVTPAVYRIEYLFPSFHFLPFLSLDYSVALAVCFLPVTSSHGLLRHPVQWWKAGALANPLHSTGTSKECIQSFLLIMTFGKMFFFNNNIFFSVISVFFLVLQKSFKFIIVIISVICSNNI